MFRVIGYKDLRPIDWVSGKRMPLGEGEGHICDRCGKEHAILFEVEDTETGKVYTVGSGCAKQQFGFEANKEKEVKKLKKELKEREEREVDELKHKMAIDEAEKIANILASVSPPEFTSSPGSMGTWWSCGDSRAITTSYRGDKETKAEALKGWVEKRVFELIPEDFKSVYLTQIRGGKLYFTMRMVDKVSQLVLRILKLS